MTNVEKKEWPCSPWVLVAQWIDYPAMVQEVMGSIPVGDWDFFFVPRLCHFDQLHKKSDGS